MLIIRLQRAGKKNRPEYKVVLAKKTAAAQKQFIEVLGSYNPHHKTLTIRNQEKLNYWIKDQHVEVSATVHNLFVANNLIDGAKVKAFTLPKKEVVAESAATETQPESTEAPANPANPAVEPVETEAAALETTKESPEQPAEEVAEVVEEKKEEPTPEQV